MSNNFELVFMDENQNQVMSNTQKKVGIMRYRGYTEDIVSVTIPQGIKMIHVNVFMDCCNLESLYLPEGLEYIGYGAFRNCKKLTEVELPSTVKYVGNEAFYGCSGLEKVKLSNNLESILMYTFFSCKNLKEIEIPSSVNKIGTWAFGGCSSLKRLKINEGVNSIEYCAFCKCENLVDVEIPESISYISETAFLDCPNLSKQSWLNILRVEPAVMLGSMPKELADDKQFMKECNKVILECLLKRAPSEENEQLAINIAKWQGKDKKQKYEKVVKGVLSTDGKGGK